MTTTMMKNPARTPATDERDTGMTARVTVAWAMAGAVTAGGFLVAAATLTERLSGHAVFVTAAGLFLLGAVGGFATGAALGYFGRPTDVTAAEARTGLVRAALWALPALAVTFLVTGWVAGTVLVLHAGAALPMVFATAAWLTGAAMVLWAADEAADALRNVKATVRPARRPTGAPRHAHA
ncbi:MAG TPA: hypothetical protein VK929_10420 [Longimicrobiales bacterium]|nr:hypothetical protein [Longimicrobiales bacterium]